MSNIDFNAVWRNKETLNRVYIKEAISSYPPLVTGVAVYTEYPSYNVAETWPIDKFLQEYEICPDWIKTQKVEKEIKAWLK